MVMKKIFKGGVPMVIGKTEGEEDLFLPGFRYRIGSIIYTVKGDVTKDSTCPMREVFLSDGATEIIPVDTIRKDVKSITDSNVKANGEIMEPDERFMLQQPIIEEEKKVAKKEKTIKKTKKTKREN